jgi:hypothetical protein
MRTSVPAWARPTPMWWSLPAWRRVTVPTAQILSVRTRSWVSASRSPGVALGRAVSRFLRVCWNLPALALSLGVVRPAVLLGDAQPPEFGFQAVAAAAAA